MYGFIFYNYIIKNKIYKKIKNVKGLKDTTTKMLI